MTTSANSEMVIEIIMEDDPQWPGNEIYANDGNGGYAKFCAEQDYVDHYPNPDGLYDRYFTWEFISKGTYFMYENSIYYTGIQMRWRNVHSLGEG